MGDQVLLLLIGFVLTTVLGGLLGYFFQRRAWTHQYDLAQVSAERDSATAALHELSGVLDKRRYRMLLVFWFLDRGDAGEFETKVTAYRSVLEEWNDGLNRRLALVATHFGGALRAQLEQLYEDYRRAGELLDVAIRERRNGVTGRDRGQLSRLLEELNGRNYDFAEAGLSLIVAGRIGRRMPLDQRSARRVRPEPDVRHPAQEP